jgi:hypothetical protein
VSSEERIKESCVGKRPLQGNFLSLLKEEKRDISRVNLKYCRSCKEFYPSFCNKVLKKEKEIKDKYD